MQQNEWEKQLVKEKCIVVLYKSFFCESKALQYFIVELPLPLRWKQI
jgi:hypothetical protein